MRYVGYVHAPHPLADLCQVAEPCLKGKPLAIADGPHILDLSREAEQAGLDLRMPLRQARLVCPGLQVRPYQAEASQKALSRLWEALTPGSVAVEPDGMRGAFVEQAGHDDGQELARAGQTLLRQARAALAVELSVGVGPNKLVAKAAALLQAQTGGGVRAVSAGEARAFMGSLPLRFLWPLPAALLEELARLGFHTAGEIGRLGPQALVLRFGAIGWRVWQLCEGLDREPVVPLYPPAKMERHLDLESLGPGALERSAQLERIVKEWAAEMGRALERSGQRAGRLSLQMGLLAAAHREAAPVERIAQTVSLTDIRRSPDAMAHAGVRLLHRVLEKAGPGLRAGARPLWIALAAIDLEPACGRQAHMLPSPEQKRRIRIHTALEAVRRQVGPGCIRPAAQLPLSRREAMRAVIEQGASPA